MCLSIIHAVFPCYVDIDPVIVWQSPSLIKLTRWNSAVTLYCISSHHGNCSYAWKKLGDEGGRVFPSTPVVYVNEGGLYQCTVKLHLQKVKGRVIRVYANIGQSIYICTYRSLGKIHG